MQLEPEEIEEEIERQIELDNLDFQF